MLKEHARLSRQFAITVDALTVIVAFISSFYIRRLLLFSVPFGAQTSLSDYAFLVILVPIIWWALLNMQNAYTWQRFTSLWTEYQKLFKTTAWGTLILTLIAFVFRLHNLPRSLIALFAVVSLLLLIIEKTFLYQMIGQIRKHGHNRKRTLVVGTGDLACSFANTTELYPEWGLEVIGFLAKEPEKNGTRISFGGESASKSTSIRLQQYVLPCISILPSPANPGPLWSGHDWQNRMP